MKIIILTFFVVDRLLKFYYVNWGNFVLNRGVALGVISANPFLVLVIHFLLTVLLIMYLYKSNLHLWARYSMFSIIFGSVSNLFDRFMYNGVVDYIGLWLFPKFNLADIMVVLGALLLIAFELNEYYKNNKSRRIARG